MTDDLPLVSGPGEMNPLETMMWRAEVDPRLRATVVIVDVLDAEPDWDRLVAAHEWASRAVPRLRQRVVEPYGWGAPTWATDPDFALGFHLRRTRLSDGGSLRDLLDRAGLAMMTPFDRHRPLWEAELVGGLDGGRAGYLLKVHHSLADGLSLVQILGLLHSTVREHRGDKVDAPLPAARPTSRLGATAAQTGRAIAATPSAVLDGLRSGASLLGGVATAPLATAADGWNAVTSALAAAVPPSAPGSPLLRARGTNRRLEALDVDLAPLRAAGRAVGGSLNDAYLAALLGGLRRYHLALDAPVPAYIPMGMPVNTRDPSDPMGGNRWAGIRFAAPLDDVDPAARIARVHAIVREVTGARVVDALGIIAPLLAALPSPLLTRIQGGATSANDLQASNIPGMRRPTYLAGARIERSYPFAPLPGGALMIALTSHEDTCCVAVTLDPAAVTDPDLLRECLVAGFDEVLALAGD
ncbi:wax ester/triacylglycerol synthase domain-containing protein [Actinomycetospora sp. TBRC 11914]|uniref:wax ester/triacylglycerol synthase domain-containing protein n=1 Tax=Actinomycetospora sp. TBRC 11914 TaxID=2729387 RepID=UPI0028A1FCE3|nr:wax ester/triacylglycerol synthase domain-containing protein [Actinomycetospora sp. TBRC 11914]